MLRLSRLETRTQEIVLLLTTSMSLALLMGSLFYIYLSPEAIFSITGKSGTLALAFLFYSLGYATFLIPLSIWVIGDFIINHANTPKDILKFYRGIFIQAALQFFVICVSASFLTIIQTYFRFGVDSGISNGAGGSIGLLFGGDLYRQFGLFGSSLILISLTFISGILSGLVELTSWLLYSLELVKFFFKETKHIISASYHWILAKIGISEQNLADSLLEFETSSGKYISPLEAPKFVHHFSEKEVSTDNLVGKVVELKPIENSEIAEKEKPARKKSTKAEAAIAEAEKKSSEAADDQESKEISADSAELAVTRYSKRYTKPDIALLKSPAKAHPPTKAEVQKQSKDLEARLNSFKLPGKIVDVHSGSRLTMYEFMPDAGVKLSKISSLTNDLALLLGADSIRVLTPIPGKTTVGIEVPNEKPSPLNFSELVKSCEKAAKEKPLAIALGKNVYNDVVIGDISSMPHLLISGTTGSGKSVFMNTLISSLIYTKSPKELRFLMVDPKMIELSPYNGIPHLLKPVVTDVVEAKNLLVWAEGEMDKRYKMFGDTSSRNITSFNETIEKGSQANAERKAGKKFDWEWFELPYIVIVIDELADLMITQGKEVEIPITRIAQKARAAGIHLVIATQRPSAEIVTGLIKTNFPTRIAFKVSSAIDSRTILDTSGAEKLLGNGDMLYMPNGKAIERLQASFISEEEVKKIVRTISGD